LTTQRAAITLGIATHCEMIFLLGMATVNHITKGAITSKTKMVQLPATAAIEYVAAGHFFPGSLLAWGTFVRGAVTKAG